jgi:hypothetical protein
VSDRARIRELFVKRKPFYALADVLRLTRSMDAEIAAAVTEGAVDPVRDDTGLRFSWDDVVLLALRRWTPRMIHGALDVSYRDVVPPLNRVKQIVVHLPLYQIRLLHVLAESGRAGFRGRLNASDILEHELVEVASSMDADAIEIEIPGLARRSAIPTSCRATMTGQSRPAASAGPSRASQDARCATTACTGTSRRCTSGEHGIPELDKENE